MAAQKLFVKPSNRVIQGDYLGAMEAQVGGNATVAHMVPGRIVCYDTLDNSVKECGAIDPSGNSAVPIGVLGYEDTIADYRPATITTAYAVGDKVAVHNAIGMRFKGWLATGLTVVPGTRLKAAANGCLTVCTANPDECNAIALEGLTSSGVTACWCQWRG